MDIEYEKNILTRTDRDFARYAREHGTGKAFEFYAADSAVIYQNNSNPIKGIEQIANLFKMSDSYTLEWDPFFTEISSSADMGYTLGNYRATRINESGEKNISKGFYITIWKKQTNGQWKYVFDSGVKGPGE